MKIIASRPPNFEQIADVFPLIRTERGILYCFGDTIFNPDGGYVPPQIIAHEEVHSAQQGLAVEQWWKDYLASPTTRFEYEALAHQREYEVFKQLSKNRNERRLYLTAIAKRLSGPLYGSLIGLDVAKAIIKGRESID